MHPINKIIFTKEHFGDELYTKVSQQIQLLIESGNLCTVYNLNKDKDVVIIEHVSANPLSLQPYPYFLFPDEAGYVSVYIAKKNIQQFQEEIEDIQNSLDEVEDDFDSVFEIKDSEDKGGGRLN